MSGMTYCMCYIITNQNFTEFYRLNFIGYGIFFSDLLILPFSSRTEASAPNFLHFRNSTTAQDMATMVVSPYHIGVVSSCLQANKASLFNISQEIWKRPETMFNEVFAHDTLTQYLQEQGFQVTQHYKVDPTAFRAEFQSASFQKDAHPTVAVMCEYDALPDIGHGCGHNLIAESALATGLAVRDILTNANVPNGTSRTEGRIIVLGTPGEEGNGGKINLLNNGAFDDIDFAMMAHPFANNDLEPLVLGVDRCKVEFQGRAAHASCGPWEGVNALDAAVAVYQNVSLFRQQMKPNWRIHGVINSGGVKPNIIPDATVSHYFIRTLTQKDMVFLKQHFLLMVDSAAKATGCTSVVTWDSNQFAGLMHNSAMSSVYKHFSEAEGVHFPVPVPGFGFNGSTDMGNVSLVVPSIHPGYSLGGHCMIHTREFEELAGKPEVQQYALIASTSMALTCTELFLNKDLRDHAKHEFQERIKEFKG